MEKIYISVDTARRFTKAVWAVNDTPYWYHQTLTFGASSPARHDVRAATAKLNALLDQMDKSWPDCACLWVREYQWTKGVHFHVIFLFFGDRPQNARTLHRKLAQDVFRRWSGLNGGHVVQKANRMTIPPYRARDARSLGYLTGQIRIDAKTLRAGRGERWWGWRNDALLVANSTPLSKAEASKALKLLFKRRRQYVRRLTSHT
jgi:hypothetical protein